MPRNPIRAAYRLGRELGFDPRRLRLITRLPRFLSDARRWSIAGGDVGGYFPCLADADDAAGATGSPYFLQDLLVARRIFAAAPELHVDVGSRIDGFVAHLAVFRQVTVLDV